MKFLKLSHGLRTQRSCAWGLAGLMAIAPSLFPWRNNVVQANPLAVDSDIPLELTFGDLEDGSWRQVETAGFYSQYEFSEPFLSILSLIGLSNIINSSYFTQGETVKMAGQKYLVAYRFPTLTSDLELEDLMSVWTIGQECDQISGFGSQFITRDSKIQLSLLHPMAIGSLNDIQAVDVDAVISESEAGFAQVQEKCEAAQTEEIVDEAIDNVDEILWAQEVLWLDESRFTDDLTEFDLPLVADSDNYIYGTELIEPTKVIAQAIAISETVPHIVGALSVIHDSEVAGPRFAYILCQSDEPGGVFPPPPTTFDPAIGYLSCPAGTSQTYPN